jgi:hypothetical protein
MKTTVKLNLLGENQSELGNEELVLDLGRALYKLHFQLLLLIEASNKMVTAVTTAAHNSQVIISSDYSFDLLLKSQNHSCHITNAIFPLFSTTHYQLLKMLPVC